MFVTPSDPTLQRDKMAEEISMSQRSLAMRKPDAAQKAGFSGFGTAGQSQFLLVF